MRKTKTVRAATYGQLSPCFARRLTTKHLAGYFDGVAAGFAAGVAVLDGFVVFFACLWALGAVAVVSAGFAAGAVELEAGA